MASVDASTGLESCPGFWGKLRRDYPGGPTREWHPLQSHSADVGAMVEALLTRTTLGLRLARFLMWAEFTPEHISRLAVLAALHDSGKFNSGFQLRWRPVPEVGPIQGSGHVREILALFDSPPALEVYSVRWESLLNGLEIPTWGEDEGAVRLLMASLAHHGEPKPYGEDVPPRLWAGGGRDPFAGLAEFLGHFRQWFPLAFTMGNRAFPRFPRMGRDRPIRIRSRRWGWKVPPHGRG